MNDILTQTMAKKKPFDYEAYKKQISKLKNTWLCKIPISHRGLHDGNDNLPENSLSAFQNAIDKNYAIELDIHQLKDGNLAVFHDNTLKRVCGEDVKISSLTTEDLKKYKLFDTDETIPTLDEVLEKVNGKVPLLIEIKSFDLNGKLESKLYEKLQKYKGEYAIESFNPYTLNWFKKNAPEVLRGQLIFDIEKVLGFGNFLSEFLINSKLTMPHFIATEASAVHKIDKGDKPMLTWTVKTKEQYDKVIKYCDNTIFERFNPIKKILKTKTKKENLEECYNINL